MQYLTLLLIGIIILGILLFLLKDKQNIQKKNPEDKKQEIYLTLKKEMKEFLQEHNTLEKEELLALKTAKIKKIHNKLHNNIYFTDEEVKRVVQEFATM